MNKDHMSKWGTYDFFPHTVEDPDTWEEVSCFVGYYWSAPSRGIYVDGMQVTPHEPSQIEEIVLMDKDGYYSERLSDEYADDDQILDACQQHTQEQIEF